MLEPGTLVAGYRVERVLGSGGMGAVFLARHPELPRYDALKVLKASAGLTDSNFRRRFLREAEVAATLDHPNIVTVFNRGRASVPVASRPDKSAEADLLWIAMQYVPGTDCARELAGRGRLARAWTAPPGACLAASIVVRPHASADPLARELPDGSYHWTSPTHHTYVVIPHTRAPLNL